MTMRQISSNPPPRASSVPPSLFPPPLGEKIRDGKSDDRTTRLVSGRKHTIGRCSIMYFGVIDGMAMLDVRRDGNFLGEIYAGKGESGAVNVPAEAARMVIEIVTAEPQGAEVKISVIKR